MSFGFPGRTLPTFGEDPLHLGLVGLVPSRGTNTAYVPTEGVGVAWGLILGLVLGTLSFFRENCLNNLGQAFLVSLLDCLSEWG